MAAALGGAAAEMARCDCYLIPHFRTQALRDVGGWDPYNVTEDADLGMRLARCGQSAAVIASTTYEEAPARVVPWVRQRTRWFKGWMRLIAQVKFTSNYRYLYC